MARFLGAAAVAIVTAALMTACGGSSSSVTRARACGTTATASAGPSRRHAAPSTSTAALTAGGQASTPTGGGPGGSLAATSRVTVTVPASNRRKTFSSPHSLEVPSGWTVEAWALVPGARFMAWTPQHTLLVSVPNAGAIVELVPGADPSQPPVNCVLARGLTLPQGLGFDTLAGEHVLYVAESDQVDRFAWRGPSGLATRTAVARGLPDTDPNGDDVHRVKGLTVGADHRIYVNIGSASNASSQGIAGDPPRGSVVAISPTGGHVRVVATGVRNGEGLSFAPDGVLWAAVNERDQIAYPFHGAYAGVSHAYGRVIPRYVDEHPPDEVVALTAGRNVGWPYCDPDPSHGLAHLRFDEDAQTNPGGSRQSCAGLTPIDRGLPAHSAPLGFHFLQGSPLPAELRGGAVVAVHGSWDRQPPRAPAVLWLPWAGSARTLGPAVTLISGFQLSDGSRWGRPADVLPGPDGALYVSDDTAGVIYRIVP